jgi:excisionase family DNA binding protein
VNNGNEAIPYQSLTVKAAAEKLGISTLTVRRRIKNGELKADLVKGKYGSEYLVQIPAGAGRIDELDVKRLIDRIENLNQEVGLWRGRYLELESQVKLLQAAPAIPSTTRRPWYKRLFKIL